MQELRREPTLPSRLLHKAPTSLSSPLFSFFDNPGRVQACPASRQAHRTDLINT